MAATFKLQRRDVCIMCGASKRAYEAMQEALFRIQQIASDPISGGDGWENTCATALSDINAIVDEFFYSHSEEYSN